MNTNCFAGNNGVLDPDVLALVTYDSKNNTDSPTDSADWADALDEYCVDLNNTLLTPSVTMQAPPADVLYDIQFSFEIGDDALDRARINGTSWVPDLEDPTLNQAVTGLHALNSSFSTSGVSSAFSANQLVITVPDIQVVDLLVLNFDDGSHPFHLHGHTFWVMATSQDQYFPWTTDLYSQLNSTSSNSYTANPMRRDTVMIEQYSWALIRFRSDVPGLWAFHCHIVSSNFLLQAFVVSTDLHSEPLLTSLSQPLGMASRSWFAHAICGTYRFNVYLDSAW